MLLGIIVRPFARPFTTFSGFCAIADKLLGRNGIKIDMLMYPNDLPSADIIADGYCCYSMHLSMHPTVHGIEFGYCRQIAEKE